MITNTKSVLELRERLSTLCATFAGEVLVLALQMKKASEDPKSEDKERLQSLYVQALAAHDYISPFAEKLIGLKPQNSSELH